MSSQHVANARRNAAVLAATGLTVGVLFLFPSSTNSSGAHRSARTRPTGVIAVPSAGTTRTLVVNGSAAPTSYGPVQVQIRVRGRRLLSAAAIEYPQGGSRDREINGYAIPQLQRETVVAQSAHIDTVSGATYTSDGYRQSLQAALDAAHLA
jgi:uncharacterized protein with FMN-binding domain